MNNNSIIAIYPSHTDAEAAIKELQRKEHYVRKYTIDNTYSYVDRSTPYVAT